HLVFVVDAFLARAQHGVVDVAGRDLHAPRRRHQRLGPDRAGGGRHPQLGIGQGVGNQHGDGVRLLAGRTAGAPDAELIVALVLLLQDDFLENVLVEQLQLRLIAEEAGFVDGQVFQQIDQLLPAFLADQQPVVAVEGIHPALAQAPLQTVLQEMRAPGVEIHPAFLIDEGLQKPHLGLAELYRQSWRTHSLSLYRFYLAAAARRVSADGSRWPSPERFWPAPRSSSRVMSSRTMRRPLYLPRPVTQLERPS